MMTLWALTEIAGILWDSVQRTSDQSKGRALLRRLHYSAECAMLQEFDKQCAAWEESRQHN
jgi:hypothetical protein